MTNRLEINWKLDGFVDEQRYYCSETSIDPLALPTPKVILAGDVRGYTDTLIDLGKTYYLRIGSVKNGTEKISAEKQVYIDLPKIDEFFDSVVSLIHFDGMAGTSNFIDEIGSAVWASIGSTTPVLSANHPKFGSSALGIQANNILRVTIPTALGDRDFTIEMFFKTSEIENIDRFLFSTEYYNSVYFRVSVNSATGRVRVASDNVNMTSNQVIDTSTWHHLALVRNADICKLFIDGILMGSMAVSTSYNHPTLFVGGGAPNVASMANNFKGGYIDEFRYTQGVARYTENFIPPDAQFPSR